LSTFTSFLKPVPMILTSPLPLIQCSKNPSLLLLARFPERSSPPPLFATLTTSHPQTVHVSLPHSCFSRIIPQISTTFSLSFSFHPSSRFTSALFRMASTAPLPFSGFAVFVSFPHLSSGFSTTDHVFHNVFFQKEF